LKGKIEIQENLVIIGGQSSLPMYQTIQLGAAGVPVFVSPTVGILNLVPSTDLNMGIGMNVTYTYAGTTSYLWTATVGGMIQLYAPNRYYVPQWIAYENNGILTKQNDGQTMNVAPGIALNGAPGSISVGIMTVNMLGANTSVTGYGNGGVTFSTLYVDSDAVSLSNGGTVTISIKTLNGLAFFNYFNETCSSIYKWNSTAQKYHRENTYFTLDLTNPTASVQTVTLTIRQAVSLNSDVAYVRAALS
jgi:hypothetical protein